MGSMAALAAHDSTRPDHTLNSACERTQVIRARQGAVLRAPKTSPLGGWQKKVLLQPAKNEQNQKP